ncbi:MAG TPA: Gfo/Idh/MocA family oxidoreductase [Vicinamibacterales bacterium]|nr:Gfo/Idh/MocA family oxidoreductase [Vicinamibacterales bacterium]
MSAPDGDNGAVRIGVVGVGHLGRHHARLLASAAGARLVGVADISPDRAQAAATANACPSFRDYSALIGQVDAVSIAVPTVDHLRVARDFLSAGVHVLVEKPMTSTLAEAEELLALADRAGCILAVGHTERFNPAVAAAIPLISAPRFIEVHRLSGFPDRSLDIDVVFDVMIHDLDIVLAIDHSDVVSVDAVGVPVLSHKVDIANARLKFASGCTVNLTASRISRDRVRKVRFFQRDLYVSVDYGEQELEAYRIVPKPGDRPAIEGGTVPVVKGEPLGRELQDFVDAVREGREPRVTGRDGYRALTLATRVAEAIEANERAPGVPVPAL